MPCSYLIKYVYRNYFKINSENMKKKKSSFFLQFKEELFFNSLFLINNCHQ